jgi:chemotaxis-related protein WspB
MLFLLCQIGDRRYALPACDVVEVLPLVKILPLPQGEPGLVGLFNYRGAPVPVLDLGRLIRAKPSRARACTRIILVNQTPSDGVRRVIGLLAEQATATFRSSPEAFVPSPQETPKQPWLGPVLTVPDGLIQRIDLSKLRSNATAEPVAPAEISPTESKSF